ncbi:hypothetical protein EDM00_08110 [Ornithobacterium rhinotracheale]|uniref:hypothetical protein n=1 Tax=Ornithobacterium rhinotracheale TaxID=28251 RepID=UPI00129CDD15|nr:hypothetical protein [Ornithobacterium rhinotracheale]MRI63949.1 hypothetical protein [Ornithobacterium rhinotracheale]MRJ10718.1 hypothetical protein [Ornithobacterium rhinotracheale]
MENQIYKFNQVRLYFFLFLAIVWLILFVSYLAYTDSRIYISILYFIFGVYYGFLFIKYYFFPYISIEKNHLIFSKFPTKDIDLNQITELRYFAGDYVFETNEAKVVIPKNSIKKTQRARFEHFFKSLENDLAQKHSAH